MAEQSCEKSPGARLRALVTQRHEAFAQEMLALFESTVARLEEEVRALRAENEKHRRSLEATEKREVPRKKAKRPPQEKQDTTADADSEVLTEDSSDSENEWKQGLLSKDEGEEEECPVSPSPPLEPEEETENSSDSDHEPGTAKKPQEEEKTESQNNEIPPDPEPPACSSGPPTENSSESGSECEKKQNVSGRKIDKTIPSEKKRDAFKCTVCEKSFNYKSVLKMHKLSHASTRSFECVQCGSLFAMKYRLDRHMEIHKRSRPSSCGKKATGQGSSEFVAETENPTAPEPPEVNNANFDQDYPGKRPECLQCGKAFSSTSNMRKHIRNTHNNKCSITRKLRKQVQLRHQHLACKVCEKRFRFQSELARHMRSHQEKRAKNYCCDFCLKTFRDKAYLQEHMGLHTGEKPHRCKACDKCFTFKKSHNAHMKIHELTSPQ